MRDNVIALEIVLADGRVIRTGKRALAEELGEAVDVMGGIKATLDPRGLMNPGKIFDQRARA
jgi:D-lactate dehydrogenase (cytochrome)